MGIVGILQHKGHVTSRINLFLGPENDRIIIHNQRHTVDFESVVISLSATISMGCICTIAKEKKAQKLKKYVSFVGSESVDPDTVSVYSPPLSSNPQSPQSPIRIPHDLNHSIQMNGINEMNQFMRSPVLQHDTTPKPFSLSHLNMSGMDLVQLLSLNNTFLDNGEEEEVSFDGDDIGIINDLKMEMATENGMSPLDVSFAVLTPAN